jgi:hypothetical protein
MQDLIEQPVVPRLSPTWKRVLNSPSPIRRGTPITSTMIKDRARRLGADLVGIASAATLNAFPPDPRWQQTPERISPYC